MRKLASCLVLIIVAYIAGAARHLGTSKAVAFVAPAAHYVTEAGDAVWSGVRDIFTAKPQLRPFMKVVVAYHPAALEAVISEYPEARIIAYEFSWQRIAVAVLAWTWVFVGIAWAAGVRGWHDAKVAREHPDKDFPSAVGYIWGKRPEADGQRALPLWMVAIILPVAFYEFGARVFYFAGFTVVTLIMVPLRLLKRLATIDLSRFLPSEKQAEITSAMDDKAVEPPVFDTSRGTCVDCGSYRYHMCGEIVQPNDCQFKDRADHNLGR